MEVGKGLQKRICVETEVEVGKGLENVFVWGWRWKWVKALKMYLCGDGGGSGKGLKKCICVETEVEVGKGFQKALKTYLCETELEVDKGFQIKALKIYLCVDGGGPKLKNYCMDTEVEVGNWWSIYLRNKVELQLSLIEYLRII